MKITGITLEVGGQELEFSGTFTGTIKVPETEPPVDPVDPPVDPIDPPVDPIEPPTAEIPFGDIPALQALGLLPRYRSVKICTVDEDIEWGGMGGERNEIGYMPEDHSAVVAGQEELIPGILRVADQPPGGEDFAHHPNLYWLPFLLTGDVKYIRHMEEQHAQFMAWRNTDLGSRFSSKTAGRELAWNLRDLFQLVYCQDRGYTEGDTYRATYEATRDFQLGILANPRPEFTTFGVIMWNYTDSASYGWVGWMESFLGLVENRGVAMGFEDWRPLAALHYQNIEKRIREWHWKGFDQDQAFAWKLHPEAIAAFNPDAAKPWFNTPNYTSTMCWGNDIDNVEMMTPFQRAHMEEPEFQDWPDEKIVFLRSQSGRQYTYENRAHSAYQWLAAAAEVGLAESAEQYASILYNQITAREDAWDQRHAFKGPQ